MSGHSRFGSVTGLCLALVLVAVMGCRSTKLMDPPPVAAGATPEQSRVAIIRALADQRYTVDEESPGRVRARLQRNAWTLIVDVLYEKNISIHYADSAGLDYEIEDDQAMIHENYNARVAALSKEIQRQLQVVAIESRGLPAARATPTPPPPPPAPSP